MHDPAKPDASSAGEFEGLPQPIDGLDIAAGVRRMDGDLELYLELLHDFLDTERSAPEIIATALASDDLETASRRVHTIKGLAGTFGAERLYPAALALEDALRGAEPRERIDTLLQVFAGALGDLADRLAAAQPAAREPLQPDTPPDPVRLAAACRELLPLLRHCDHRAGKVLAAHATLIRAGLPDACPQLEEAVRKYDFEIAEALLLSACARRGIALTSA